MPGWKGFPGKRGSDYQLVRYGDRFYVVYRVKLPNGKSINVSWKVERNDFKGFGVQENAFNRVGKQAFNNLNVFGSATEIVKRGSSDEHPFQTYINHLREVNHGVSWLQSPEMMEIMLMGWAENWTAAELQQRLSRTKWYQNRTEYQRTWELDKSKGQRQAETQNTEQRVLNALQELYGPSINLKEAGITNAEIKKWSQRIASGDLGDPADGFEIWLAGRRRVAEKVEGSTAWIERQQELEAQRAFMNRPEDVREQIRQEAFEWLGPNGVPDQATLIRWSEDLVSERKTDADWQTFLRKQATNLYPYLGPEERWQDRASTYKRVAEEQLGAPIDWDDAVLNQLGAQDQQGAFTGDALSIDDFTKQIRSQDRWWDTSLANEEGFKLANYLNETFSGVR
jgi:hypothetical protein